MPIVNGQYVPQTLGTPETAQNAVFGMDTKKDMSDYSAAAYNYLMKQQEQAYNLELWNLQNEYNSPASQMQRYQDAGLNPNLIYTQQNMAGAPQAASATSFRPQHLRNKQAQNAISIIGQVQQLARSARETYDYLTYGRGQSAWQLMKTQEEAARIHKENEWNEYLLTGGTDDPETRLYAISHGPRATMYKHQSDTAEQRYEQLKAIVGMIPDQAARLRALKALDEYRLKILKGQNDAVLNLQTGNAVLDSWLHAILYFGMSKI